MYFKPNLACDVDLDKLKFPCIVMPKIDGVRAINHHGVLYARSMKQHPNKYATEFFSQQILDGLDGEMAAELSTHKDLCRLTTSALSTISGTPFLVWHLFDYYCPANINLGYSARLGMLQERVAQIKAACPEMGVHLMIVPSYWCENLEEYMELRAKFIEQGYEGTIVRDPNGKYKQGRSTVREGGYLRDKPFVHDAECELIEFVQGQSNNNDAKINELGMQYRSTEKAGMVPNGMVGSLTGRIVNDIYHPVTGIMLFERGDVVTVGPGEMKHPERKACWENRQDYIGKVFKFKFFPHGIKDALRFPTFKSWRDKTDMVDY